MCVDYRSNGVVVVTGGVEESVEFDGCCEFARSIGV